MKDKWAILKQHLLHGDVFKRTQNKLTLQYSTVLIAFLILFVSAVYALLYFLLITEQKNELSSWIDDKTHLFHESMEHTGNYSFAENLESGYASVSAQTISYLVTTNGQQIFGSNASPELCQSIAASVSGWKPEGENIRYKTLFLEESERRLAERKHGERDFDFDSTARPGYSGSDPSGSDSASDPGRTHDVRMLLAVKNIYDNSTLLGTLYVGKDVTSQYALFRLLFMVLVVIAFLFCGLAVFLSRKMSVRAMVPIRTAYMRQKEFVADASHELRTPLSIIQASIDTLEMDEELEQDTFNRKVLGHMKEEAKRMTKLLGGMLTLARSDSEATQLNLQSVDLSEVARLTIEAFLPLVNIKSIMLDLEIPESCVVQADGERLKQLMIILLDNALKYTPDGGKVKLSIVVREEKRRTLHLSVKDTGIGIPVEEQQKVFDRFYRVDKSRTRDLGGHGLGLSIAKWITEAHGGRLDVESVPGQGSTFTVSLPAG
ncbi:sensor histidine kinase [Paenibacillus physcomitrellae]|uniref:histidine kinase n=1 Tax=Paenibacillus physcomitrellae TaxID=1619311 RepID=A0ABQ1GJM0_9BACL|nr:ATP-binding protein [Paenibacillus physcomitrellae]GGA44950.1 hypothetical protein GCM10010917_32850 [Paenibacillus physcomitrellae]